MMSKYQTLFSHSCYFCSKAYRPFYNNLYWCPIIKKADNGKQSLTKAGLLFGVDGLPLTFPQGLKNTLAQIEIHYSWAGRRAPRDVLLTTRMHVQSQIEPRLTRVARLRAKKWILWCVCAWECVCVTSLRFVSEHPTFQLREPTVLLVKTLALSVALIDCLAFIGDCTWSGQKSTGLKERNRMEKWPWQNRTRVDGSVFTVYVGALPTRPSAQTTTCI